MSDERRRILLIDDSELTLQVERAYLESAGYEVRTLSSIDRLGAVLEAWSPDLVLTDVDMPVMDGAELCRLIKARIQRLVPVVLFSSLPDRELEALAQRCGADGYLSKSSGLESLAQRVDELCGSILW